MRDRVSLEQILASIETARKEINVSQNKILILLIVSSAISIFWADTIFSFKFSYELRILLITPFILNITSWLFYAMQYFTPRFNNERIFNRDIDDDYRDREEKIAVQQSQRLNYLLYSQRKIERVIVPIIVLQFISMSAIFIILFQIRF